MEISNEAVEAAARNIIRSDGGKWVDMAEEWNVDVRRYHEMCAKFPDYAKGGSLLSNAFRRAHAALAPVPAREAVEVKPLGYIGIDSIRLLNQNRDTSFSVELKAKRGDDYYIIPVYVHTTEAEG